MRKKGYTILQWTWGLPQTLIGSAVYLAHRKDRHFDYKGACVTEWGRDSGLSLGKFVFVPRGTGSLLKHEYGHTLQSLLLGPAYLLLIGAPSVAWFHLPLFRRMREKTGRSYYSAVFEKTADKLGGRDTRR